MLGAKVWFAFQAAIVATGVFLAYGEVEEPRSAMMVLFVSCMVAYALTVGLTALGDLWRRIRDRRLPRSDESPRQSPAIPSSVPRDIFDLTDSTLP